MKMKIKYVQLESDAFLTDIDFVQFTPAERGVYCSLILYLTSNDGKCTAEPEALSRICNCDSVEQFEKIWEKVSKKFQIRSGVIKHKRVTKELKRARDLLQAKRKAGLNGAKQRWQNHDTASGTANGNAMANRSEGNVIGKEDKDISNTNTINQSLSSSSSVRSNLEAACPSAFENQGPRTRESEIRALHFSDALERIIKPRSRSDRTCFRNVARWLAEGCARGRFSDDIFGRVLDLAREALHGRNHAAVFMHLLKEDLGYSPKGVVE
jgi:uncharacterized protein YdaU (DUF1376 family)